MLKKILSLLTPKERRRAYLLLFMIMVMAFLEMVGVASVMPFVSVLANPEVVQTNVYLAAVYDYLGFEDARSFMYFLGLAMLFFLIGSIAFKALTTYAILRFTHMRGYSLSRKLVQSYLRQPYDWFLNKHSADLGKSILSEAQQVVNGAVLPLLKFIAALAVLVSLTVLLIVVEPLLALAVALGLGGTYGLIYFGVRSYLTRIGAERVRTNKERFQAVQEAFGGIKEVKVCGLEAPFLKRFEPPANRFARVQANAAILGQLPRFILEAIAFGGVFIVILYMMGRPGGLQEAVPILAVYLVAGQKLMPVLSEVYQHLAKLRFTAPALDSLYHDLMRLEPGTGRLTKLKQPAPLGLEHGIRLENIYYTYPGATQPALNDLSLDIPARTTVGIVGATGSGKTTTVDIILGLLRPQHGQLLVDGQPIFEAESSKQKVTSVKSEAESSNHNLLQDLNHLKLNTYNSSKIHNHLKHKTLNSSLIAHHSANDSESASSPNNLKLKTYNTLRSWQRALGYVPQHIYLADETVAANIAFGIPPEEIDMQAVHKAAQIAELHEFVTTELSQGYETLVGERGVRLSGGQRQRIGIARALYHDPAVLIFDEATSALDNLTEKAVMQAINNLNKEKTIIMIAHRLSTVEKCDSIFVLEHGRLVAQGTYDQLLDASQEFQKMAAVNE